MGSNPSSDDLIRQAKESLAAPEPRPEMHTQRPVEEVDPTRTHRTVTDRMQDGLERDRVVSTTSHPSRVPTQTAAGNVAPKPDSSSKGTRAWRVLGILTLGSVAALWALLILGIALDPSDAGEAIGGGAILTVIPATFGVYSLRRANR